MAVDRVSDCMASAWESDPRQMIYRTFNRMFFQHKPIGTWGKPNPAAASASAIFSFPPVALLAQQQTRRSGSDYV